ncbi:tape measure protein [Acinetobacter guillouiae]|uniref:tape measure protein n=1 Tax=Acinetobacter guillouiae TaxID=106649 RepID=UPI003AF5757C
MATKLGSLTLDLICRTGNFTQGMRDASNSANRELGRIEQSTIGATSAIKGMAVAALGAFSLSQLSSYADGYIGLQNRLKLVASSQKELTQATEDTYRISQVTASSWDSTAQVYQRFAQNAKSLGINLKQAASLTETVTKAIAISGGTAASSEAALVQFSQALSSGILRGEEYNSISEQAGGLRDAIAKGLNISVGDLRNWANEGKLTTDVVVKALTNAKVSVDDLFGKTDFTGAQGWQLIQDAAMKTVGEFSKATGASKAMFESLKLLSENMGVVTNTLMIGGAYMAGTYIPTIYKSVVAAKTKIATLLEEIQTENAAIIQTQRKAQAEYNASQAELTRARDAVVAAEMQVNANRAVIGSEIQRIQATIAATNAEKAQEIQNHKSQITDIGRSQSVTRMAQLQQVLAAQTAELTVLEGKLASTTLASSNVYVAARNAETTATGRATVATNQLNIANSLTTRSSMGLVGALGGPVGLGIMVASVAAGFLLMRDSSKDTQSALEEQGLTVDELKVKYSQLNAEQLKLKALGASDAIEAENEKIRTLFITLERYISDLNGQGKTDRANALQQYLEDLKVGGDRAKNAFARLEKQRVVNPEDIAYAAKMGAAVKSSTNEVDKQNQILSIASNKHIEHAKAAKTGAEGVAQFGREAVGSAAQIKGLSAEVQKFISETLNTISSNSEVLALRAKGISKEYAEGFVKLRQMQGLIGKDTPVDMGAFNLFLADLSIKEKIKNLDDQQAKSEKDKTKELERQQKVREKHAALLASSNEQTRNMLKVYQAFLNAGVDDVKARVLTSQVGREGDFLSKNLYGNHTDAANGKTNTGFISWQGDRSKSLINYLRSQGVLDDKGNIQQTQEALDAQAKFFIQEVMSQKRYLPSKNALVGTSDNYRELEQIFGKNAIAWDYAGNSIGKDKASKNLAKQDGYYAKLGKLLGENPDSFLGSFKDLSKQDDDVYKLKTRIEDEKKSLIEFYDDWQKLENNNSEQVKKIRETFAKDPKAMKDHLALQEVKYQEDVENYIKAGDDRVKADYQATQDIIDARQAAFDNINNPLYSIRDKGVEAIAQSSLSPLAYQKWDLNRQQQDGFSQLGDDLNTGSLAISKSDILSEQEKKDKLLQIEQEYQDAKLALAQTYDQQHRDLEDQTQAASLAGYGAMFGMMGSMFDAYGDKESTGYKVAFAMQKAFVLSSAILNAKGAVMAAWNDPANTTIWQKMAAAAATVVQTNDLMSAIQGVALTGMAHDGIANVPEEGTWLLSKGERVLNPQDNKALTNMINNGGGGGDVTIQVSVTDSGVNTSGGNTQDQRQFAQVVGNAVRAVIIQEKRQGGLLSK